MTATCARNAGAQSELGMTRLWPSKSRERSGGGPFVVLLFASPLSVKSQRAVVSLSAAVEDALMTGTRGVLDLVGGRLRERCTLDMASRPFEHGRSSSFAHSPSIQR